MENKVEHDKIEDFDEVFDEQIDMEVEVDSDDEVFYVNS